MEKTTNCHEADEKNKEVKLTHRCQPGDSFFQVKPTDLNLFHFFRNMLFSCPSDPNLDIVDSKATPNKPGYTTYIMQNGYEFDCPPNSQPIACDTKRKSWGVGRVIPATLPVASEKK